MDRVVAYTFNLRPKLDDLSKLRTKIEHIFEKENIFDELTRKNILLALTELFVNIVKHGNSPRSKFVKFHIKRFPSFVELTMYDNGNTYDPTSIKPPNISELPESGFGVFLVKSLMDSFEYYPKDKSGDFNITKIIKNI